MKTKNIYILTLVLSIIVIIGVFYKKEIDKSKELKREEVLQASDKLQQIYSVLESDLSKVDAFSNLYLNSSLPKRGLICFNQKMNDNSHNKIHDLKSNMKVLDYDLEFLPDIMQAISLTDVYTQDLKSPEYLKVEKDASGFLQPINYWNYINEYGDEHQGKESWNMKLLEAVDFEFAKCDLKSDELAKKYNKYNYFLKDEIKMRMKKIEDFYTRNNLNLTDLKSKSE